MSYSITGQKRSTVASTSAYGLDTSSAKVAKVSVHRRKSRTVLEEDYKQKLIKRHQELPIESRRAYYNDVDVTRAETSHSSSVVIPQEDNDDDVDVGGRVVDAHDTALPLQHSLNAPVESFAPTLKERETLSSPTPATAATSHPSHVSLSRNIPLQLVIIIGAVVLFAMFVASLAWLCRASSKTSKKTLGRRTRKSTWSPGGPSSLYTYSSSNQSESSLIMSGEKSRPSQSALSPISPMPVLKDEKGELDYLNAIPLVDDGVVKVPRATATAQINRGKGWQLFDNPVPGMNRNGEDVESARPPPARRPSFIDRLLAHRADPNDARLPSQLGVDGSHVETNLQTPGGRKTSGGGALLSVLSVSLPAWPNALRSKDNGNRMAALESDFEGTIGGKDDELPMAKRVRKSQGRFACDASTEVPTPQMQRQSWDRDQFTPLPNRLSAATILPQQQQGTPRTPGLAGVGSMWTRGMQTLSPLPITRVEANRPPTFAELQRQPVNSELANRWSFQTTIDKWVEGSKLAVMPPPPSRRGSSNSFRTVGEPTPILISEVKMDGEAGLERMVSIRPHFAPTTTLASWLVQEEQKSPVSGKEEDSIIEKYLIEEGGSQVSSDTDFDRKRGMLWEVEEPLPPPYQSERASQSGSKRSSKGRSHGEHRDGHQIGWNHKNEELEEEKRQIDRRQKMLLKEKRKADRRLAKQLQQHGQEQQMDEATLLENVRQQRNMHLVLNMDAKEEEETHRIRLEPSFNDFNAPVLSQGDLHVVESRRNSNTSKIVLADRPPTRADCLSPPESPLTSASEGYSRRRAPNNFLVASSRSRSSGTSRSGSNRSVSHGALLSSMQSPDSTKLESLVQSKKLSRRQHSQQRHQASTRSVSDQHHFAAI